MSLLSIDIGSTNCKVCIFDLEGNMLTHYYKEYDLISPGNGWVEISPEIIFNSVKDLIKESMHNHTIIHDPVECIGVSSQGEAVLPIDKNGKILNNAPMRFDLRTSSSYNLWNNNFEKEAIYKITGMPLHPMHTINKIIWFKENMPQIYEKTWKFLCFEDFIIYKLCGEPVIDYSLAARTMMFDIHKKDWSHEMLSKGEIDKSLLPQIEPSGKIVGKINNRLAHELGLNNNVYIATGGHDQACGSLGSGIIEKGIASNSFGTSDALSCLINPPEAKNIKNFLSNNIPCYPNTVENAYMTIVSNFSGGSLLKWWRDVFSKMEIEEAKKNGENVYDILLKKATIHPVDIYLIPHFAGSGTPNLDPDAKGAIFGLTLKTTKNDLIRAILDGINFQMKLNIEMLEELGNKIDEVRVMGGGAQSDLLLQLRANVIGKKVVSLNISEAVCLGVAMLSGKAIGKYSSLEEAVKEIVKVKKTYSFNKEEYINYHNKYQSFLHCLKCSENINRICYHRNSNSKE